MDIREQTISGIGWSGISQGLRQVLTIGIGVSLARILIPADFGLVALVSVFTRFAGVLGDFGFSSALIQRQKVTEAHYSAVFWFNLFLGLIITIVILLISPTIATFFEKPQLQSLAMLAAVNFSLTPLSAVHRARLRRELSFRSLGITDITGVCAAGVTGIGMAHAGYGVWSLVTMEIAATIAIAVSSFWMTRWLPQVRFDRSALKDLSKFSLNMMGTNVINYWIRNLDNLLIGKFLGEIQLGLYSRAYNLMLMPVSQISEVLRNVMFPSLSRVGDEIERVRTIYLRSTAAIWFVSAPLMVGLFAVSPHAIPFLLGDKWLPMIPIFRLLCLLGAVQSVLSTVGWIYLSQGRTDLMFKWSVFAGIIIMTGFAIGVSYGSAYAVALSYCITSGVILSYPSFVIPGRLIQLGFCEFAWNLSGITSCAALMGFLVLGIDHVIPDSFSHRAFLLILIPIGIVSYTLLAYTFRLRAFQDVYSILKERWPKRT